MEFEATRARNERGLHLTGANSYHDSAAVEDVSSFLPDSLMPLSSAVINSKGEVASTPGVSNRVSSSESESSATLLASADGKKGMASGNASKPKIRSLRQRWGSHVASLARFPDQLGGSGDGMESHSVGPNDIIGMRVVRGIDVEGDITSMAGQVGVIIRRMPSRKPLRYGVTAEQILKEQALI